MGEVMDEWWYDSNNSAKGPCGIEELSDLFNQKVITIDTRVWRKGKEEWLPLREVKELRSLISDMPQPTPTSSDVTTSTSSNPIARAWKRFFG